MDGDALVSGPAKPYINNKGKKENIAKNVKQQTNNYEK